MIFSINKNLNIFKNFFITDNLLSDNSCTTQPSTIFQPSTSTVQPTTLEPQPSTSLLQPCTPIPEAYISDNNEDNVTDPSNTLVDIDVDNNSELNQTICIF